MEIFLIVLGISFVLLIVLYNRLVALRQNRKNAFADIDVQLKQRFDLVPNLVATVKGYATHEKDVFTQVTEARANVSKAASMKERALAESALGQAMMNVLAVAENYPELKANQNFLSLQNELADLENKIAAARRFFNNATNEYNTGIQQFPAIVVERLLNLQQEEFFDLAEDRQAANKAPSVAFN